MWESTSLYRTRTVQNAKQSKQTKDVSLVTTCNHKVKDQELAEKVNGESQKEEEI